MDYVEDSENGPTCIVSGCKFRYNANSKRFKVYQFPTDPEMIEKWLEKLQIPSKIWNHMPESSAIVCYSHFHEHDFERNNKKRKLLKSTAVPSLHLSNGVSNSESKLLLTSKEQKEEINSAIPKENGWWHCNSCSSQNFLFFFELTAHWREHHGFNIDASKHHYDKITLEHQVERDSNMAKYGWTCEVCQNGEKFDHKFQLVSHWHKQHSNPDITYEVCQWCSELFTSPESSAAVRFLLTFCLIRLLFKIC